MAEHKEYVEAHIGIKAEAEAVYGEATFKRIVEDAVFFRRRAAEDKIDDGQRKRYARIIILLVAFYLESLSNLIHERLGGRRSKDDKRAGRGGLAGPILKFREVYCKHLDRELSLNTDGVQDIFIIRNKIIAHPAGRAQLQVAGVRRGRLDKQVSYKKFTDFPLVYSWFTLQEADAILKEVKEFG